MEQVELAPTLRPLLSSSEKIISVQNKVGLYKGTERDEEHDNGTVYLTTHRIVYVDQARPHERSVALDLARVKRSSVHSGFIYSSGKIHLHIAGMRDSSAGALGEQRRGSEPSHLQPSPSIGRSGWQCPICDHMNGGSADKCTLCGVPYEEPAQKAELQLTCPVCTFHNHVSMARCEMCETELKRPVPPTPDQDLFGENALQPYRMRSLGAESDDEDAGSLLKLSFRAGGSSTFHSALKEVLGDKAWLETVEAASSSQQQQEFPADRRPTVGGISTLVSAAHESERTRDDTLKTAFADLDGLAAKAKEIVSLAEKIATQLNSPAASKLRGKGIGSGGDDDNTEQADAFRQYLLDLGIDSPVTKDTAGAMFHEELARELSDFLENYVARHGGTVALVDAYCLYNRAREFSLVYPADFVQACRNFGRLRLALRLREYPSGLLTIEDASSASDAAIIQRVDQYIRSFGPLSSSELAAIEECSLPLAEEHLALCERAGQVCRDETVEGVRFHMNQFTQSAGVA